MDNISIKKIWQDDSLIELEIHACSEYVSVFQTCYIQDIRLEEIADKLRNFCEMDEDDYYLEFGSKQGNYTPAFSMNLLKADPSGNVKIEMDMEIADNDERKHRCMFYVESELGAIDRLSSKIKDMVKASVGEEISMFTQE